MECIQKWLNGKILVTHHLESYNQFIQDIPILIKNQNPLINFKKKVEDEFKHECRIWVGGKNVEYLQFGQPIFHENGKQKPMYPNDARLRNMTYSFSLQARLTFEFIIEGVIEEHTTEDYVFIGYIPIMLQSSMCILHGLPSEVRFNMGECISDPGGYFVIEGSEKVIICQEGRANNLIYTTKNYDDRYYYCADIKSESEDKSNFPRTTSVRIVTEKDGLGILTRDGFSLHEMVVDLPDVRTPIPLFIVMRALGIISDKQIIQTCLLGENNLQEHFHDSVCDAGSVYTQLHAIKFIGTFTKYKSYDYAMYVLSTLFLPHIGSLNFIDKAYFLGFMVKKVLRLAVGIDSVTDRDSFRMKRIDTTGVLLTNLFNDCYNQQMRHVQLEIDRLYNKNEQLFDNPEVFSTMYTSNYHQFFKERVTETGILHGFKGAWGATDYTRKVGVSQMLNRISFNSSISHLRKCVLQIDDSAKVTAPRLLHGSQWGYFDPVDTPDGGDVGTHKHLSICTRITNSLPKQIVLDEMEQLNIPIVLLEQSNVHNLSILVKVFLNGHWIGSIEDPLSVLHALKNSRRRGRLPSSVSISWNISENILYLYTDAGRVQRPVFYVENGQLSYAPDLAADLTWAKMITGTARHPCMIEYIDPDESNTALISFNLEVEHTKHTHVEIHGSTLLGFMGNQIIFPEHNQLPRNAFSCGQSKQAVSLYHTNYQNRMDTMGVVLNYAQKPLVQSSFLDSFGTLPYGINAIVAIMCYTGYNTEDAILFNKGSLERGLFNTSYFKTYEMHETGEEFPLVFEGGSNTDEHGLVHEDTEVTSETVLMRMKQGEKIKYIYPKKDQLGRVDRTFMSDDTPGHRIAKVRICHERSPNIGDKFASRAGQKGTCGLIIREEDMPFTSKGVRPDLIINPHALPSRMTIGQLIECLTGKVHLINGGLGDCTVFNTGDTKPYRDQLSKMGYHNSGNEILYNGMTGEMLESDIFIGPTYYLRLKHMVADKVNFRSRGPNTALTRQPVQGRSNEGGLRIGEMERDGVIANGMSSFVRESMMERGDGTMLVHNSRKPYEICVDNSTGLLAVHNANVSLSPALDGMTFENDVVTTIPKYERTFSTLNVPYSFKLLMQECLTMGVQMRLITSDTIDHFDEMRYREILQVRECLLSLLPRELLSVKTNTLYVALSHSCDPEIRFYHKNLNETIFPWLSTDLEFQKLRVSARTIHPKPHVSLYQKERSVLDIYRTNEESFDVTLDYFLNKMKTGVFVRIKNNKVFNFLPLYNANYRNDFHDKINVEEFLKTLPEDKLRQTSKDASTWHATNCLIRTEKTDRDPTDAYLSQLYDMLVETCSHRKVNDCIFFMTRKDFPHLRKDWKESFEAIYGDNFLSDTYKDKPFLPVVAQSTTKNHADFAFPTGDDWDSICPEKYFASFSYSSEVRRKAVHCRNTSTPKDIIPWDSRAFKVIWRGQATGCGNTETTNPRMWLHDFYHQDLDAGITRYTKRIKGEYVKGELKLEYIDPPKSNVAFMDMKDQMKYKFAINVEGNSAAYRFGQLLGLGFCVINIRSNYKLWFEPFLKVGKYDDPMIEECDCIEMEFGESISEVINWCKENDSICKKISENGMKFYEKYFTKNFVYDYVSDLCNTISGVLHEQDERYEEVKKLVPKKEVRFELFTNEPVSTNTTILIVPFRDTGDQNRTSQLEKFIEHYKGINVLVVEQSKDRLFNRGVLLNIGYDYVTKYLPQVTSFVVHDVDILMPPYIVDRYYGDDGNDFVHLGLLVDSDKYNNPAFLGRVMRFSKKGYQMVNGFPNTFYGWGGEDDAMAYRLGANVVYRPDEMEKGIEMETENDILRDKSKTRREKNKHELLIADTLQWKMEGLNSLQYSIIENKPLNECVRKITVQLAPTEQMGGGVDLPVILEATKTTEQIDNDVSTEMLGGDSLETSTVKIINM